MGIINLALRIDEILQNVFQNKRQALMICNREPVWCSGSNPYFANKLAGGGTGSVTNLANSPDAGKVKWRNGTIKMY